MKRKILAAFCCAMGFFLYLTPVEGAPADKAFMLIAHRGGVVDQDHSENSLKAMEEAIRRGYTHVEVDARCTKDGHVVCFHENNYVFNSPVDLTREEIDGFHRLGLKVIASVNVDHYRGKKVDSLKQGLEDIRRMLDWGVDGLQIDSCYDPLVFERMAKK